MLWQVLIEFVFRLAFGLTAAMAVTSARDVTSGFFRVHLWVGLGLNTFSAAVVATMPTQLPQSRPLLGISILAATLSYVGSIFWLYEKATPGRWVLWFVTAVNLAGACFASASGVRSDLRCSFAETVLTCTWAVHLEKSRLEGEGVLFFCLSS